MKRDDWAFAVRFLCSDRSPAELANARRWDELRAVRELIISDAPEDLAMTDPALYKKLRDRITELRMCGWGRG